MWQEKYCHYWLMTDKLNPSPKLARISHPIEPSFTVPDYSNELNGANWMMIKENDVMSFSHTGIAYSTSFLLLSCIPRPEFIIKNIRGWCIF